MDLMLLGIPSVIVLFLHSMFSSHLMINILSQLVIFLLTAHLPCLLTGRMSYVDVAWPWGLVAIGILPLLSPPEVWTTRSYLVMAAFLLAGGRMALGGAIALKQGRFNQEFQRYNYQRLEWAKSGITSKDGFNFNLIMQKEIFVQAVANMGPLSIPLMVQVYGGNTSELSLVEIAGWTLWLLSLIWEHTADKQKKKFIKECLEKKIKGQVCDVGLWGYCRHPNYFGEWMVWNSLILTTIPSSLQLLSKDPVLVNILIICGLISISYIMYLCLVHYTGAVPSEYYSLKSRPGYVQYQKRVNMFIPGFGR